MKKLILLLFTVMGVNITFAQLSTKEQPISFYYNDIPYKGKIYEQECLDLDKLYKEDLKEEEEGIPPRFGFRHIVNYTLENSGEWI